MSKSQQKKPEVMICKQRGCRFNWDGTKPPKKCSVCNHLIINDKKK